MVELVCPRCGMPLLPNDQGICPSCRMPVVAATELSEPMVLSAASVSTDAIEPFALPPGPAPAQQELQLFYDTVQALRGPQAAPGRGGLWLVLSLIAFVLVGRGQQAPLELAIVAGVIFFHELGHWLGMKIFGYRDLKIFFIPFFGGAASGTKEGVPQWQQAIVVLLGPLPGIVVGLVCLIVNQVVQQPLVGKVTTWLLLINGFNLLPLVPLDGGRFLNILIFSRNRLLEALFTAVTSTGIVALAVFSQAYLIAAFGVFWLIMVPGRYRVAGAAANVRRRWSQLPDRIGDAEDFVLLDVFHECDRLLSGKMKTQVPARVNVMRPVYEQAIVRPVGALASLGLLAAYAGGIALCFLSVAWMVLAAAAARPAGN